jgi:A/G-specific adenine glycosylase
LNEHRDENGVHAGCSRPSRTLMKAALLSWYETNGRDLPWRKTNDPYAILVSEVMLQQTWVTSPDPVQ